LSGSASARVLSWDPSSGLPTFVFYDVGNVPGIDYDTVVTDQPIDLDGRPFFAIGASDDLCYVVPALQNGLTYTLVSTTGGLSGRLRGAAARRRRTGAGRLRPQSLGDGRSRDRRLLPRRRRVRRIAVQPPCARGRAAGSGARASGARASARLDRRSAAAPGRARGETARQKARETGDVPETTPPSAQKSA